MKRIFQNKTALKKILVGLAIFSIALPGAFAAAPPGVTTAPYTIAYNARLTDSTGAAITTTQDVRFSLWSNNNFDSTNDLLPSGDFNPSAPGYTGWEETHTVTPDSNGLFQVRLGTINTLPNFNSATQIYLEVDVEPTGGPLTSFQVLDPHPPLGDNNDRFPLDSSAFAINSDTLDNHDAGTSPGNVPILDSSGLLQINEVPGATDSSTFILNNNDNPGNVTLQFGNTLGKFLDYDTTAHWFDFNDNVNIQGNLTTTGTINGVTFNSSTVGPYNQSKVFDPEYAGGVIEQDVANVGGNQGTLFGEFSNPDNVNYYHWSTQQTPMQDIFVVIKANVPEGFSAWQSTPLQFTYRTGTASTADNELDVSMTDTAGNPVALSGATGLTSTTFATSNITFTGAPTFTPGQPFTITVKLSADSAGTADAGRIQLNYTGR